MCDRPEAGFFQRAYDMLPNPEDYYVIGACYNSSEVIHFTEFRRKMNFNFSISDMNSLGASFGEFGVNFVAINSDKIYTSYQTSQTNIGQLYSFLVNAPSGIADNSIDKHDLKISNYPNPFNGTTSISFNLENKENCELSVFNSSGSIVGKLLTKSELQAGSHSYKFNAENLTSGIYFVRAKIGSTVKFHKINYIK